jgi:membrane protease YdiL (CAAX protease family)
LNEKKLIDWIFSPPRDTKQILLILTIIGLDFIQSTLVGGYLFTNNLLPEYLFDSTIINSWAFIFHLLFDVVYEEFLYRIIPLAIALRYIKSEWFVLMIVLISSLLFGYHHGSYANILIQGIGGLLYSLIFIKYSEGGTKLIYAGTVVILTHLIYNTLIALSVVASGGVYW